MSILLANLVVISQLLYIGINKPYYYDGLQKNQGAKICNIS